MKSAKFGVIDFAKDTKYISRNNNAPVSAKASANKNGSESIITVLNM